MDFAEFCKTSVKGMGVIDRPLYTCRPHSYNNRRSVRKALPDGPGSIDTPFRWLVPPATERCSQARLSSKSCTVPMDLYR
jgi:hypothetical protein